MPRNASVQRSPQHPYHPGTGSAVRGIVPACMHPRPRARRPPVIPACMRSCPCRAPHTAAATVCSGAGGPGRRPRCVCMEPTRQLFGSCRQQGACRMRPRLLAGRHAAAAATGRHSVRCCRALNLDNADSCCPTTAPHVRTAAAGGHLQPERPPGRAAGPAGSRGGARRRPCMLLHAARGAPMHGAAATGWDLPIFLASSWWRE